MTTTALETDAARPGFTPGRLIVCERAGQWSVALRTELAASGVRFLETRTLGDTWAALGATPAAMVVVELTSENAAGLLRRLVWLSRDFPSARVAVVAARPLAPYERLAREAGAVHFTCSPRRLGPLAALAIRHLAGIPLPQQTLAERIWASLPWGEKTSAAAEITKIRKDESPKGKEESPKEKKDEPF